MSKGTNQQHSLRSVFLTEIQLYLKCRKNNSYHDIFASTRCRAGRQRQLLYLDAPTLQRREAKLLALGLLLRMGL